MMVAFIAQKASWDCELEPRFGRTPAIVLLDTERNSLALHDNTRNADLGHGAGIQTAQAIMEVGASAVITVSLGPKAFGILQEATIPAYYATSGHTIKMAWDLFQAKQLPRADAPNH
ncbi:MAG: dinitrogenase iron-molybdenum cofactor biosynthesis protein [Burkholderiales bacterium]|nr:MAG: dinitrogenase iron-molybdenum cofactor biosynthesis protein [Burkholderiales bacterium]